MCDAAVVTRGRGRTAMHYAALRGFADIVQLLLRNGASPILVDHFGKTAYVWRCECAARVSGGRTWRCRARTRPSWSYSTNVRPPRPRPALMQPAVDIVEKVMETMV